MDTANRSEERGLCPVVVSVEKGNCRARSTEPAGCIGHEAGRSMCVPLAGSIGSARERMMGSIRSERRHRTPPVIPIHARHVQRGKGAKAEKESRELRYASCSDPPTCSSSSTARPRRGDRDVKGACLNLN